MILAGAFVPARAQVQLPTANPQTKFSNGQDVVPVYEGWLRNADGTFTFVFGYFNRNWQEEPVIPAGPDNKIEPGVPDRGFRFFCAGSGVTRWCSGGSAAPYPASCG